MNHFLSFNAPNRRRDSAFFLSNKSFRLGLTLAIFVLFSTNIFAQTTNTATVRGQVLDQNKAAIAGANVVVVNESTGLRRETQTGEGGNYTIADLPLTGKYKLTVTSANFAAGEKSGIEFKAGEAASIDIVLSPQISQNYVTVLGTTAGVQSDSAQLGTRLDLQKIDNTPVLGRKITNLVGLNSAVRPARGTGDLFLNNFLFVANGAGRRQTSFILDGSTGDDAWGRQTIFTNLPFSTIQEFTVLTNAVSAEFGRTVGSVVNVVTKSGTNNFSGDALFLVRPSAFQARAPLAASRTRDRLFQLSGVVSGPIIKDKTHFLIGAEVNRQRRDTVISSPLAPGAFDGKYNQNLFFARLDHQINDKNTLTARFNLERFTDSNPSDAVGGNNLGSAARSFERDTYAAQLSETAVLSSRIVNQARFEFQLGSPITQFTPVNPSTQFIRPISVEGESRSAFLQNHQYQFADTLSLSFGKQNIKLGGDAEFSSSGGDGQEFGSGFVLGQFRFTNARASNPSIPTSALTIADAATFTQSFGNASYNVREWLYSVFAQDDWRVRRDLTLNLGLRYERQTFTDDKNNFAPRLGFAYNFLGDNKTVVRGSYGVYYSEVRANLGASFALAGPTGIFTFTAAPGQFGFPTSLNALPAFPAGANLPARDIVIRPGRAGYYNQFFDTSKLRGYPDKLLNPITQQATIGIERDLSNNFFLKIDYVRAHTSKIDRLLDLNAPGSFVPFVTLPTATRSVAQANLTRPITPVLNGYRRIQVAVNEGISDYNGLQINLEKRFSRNFSFLASYTLSKTTNTVEPDANNTDPNDVNSLGEAERGLSPLNQKHRFVLSGYYQLPYQFAVGGITTAASGRPYNITAGVDTNGDGSNADRPFNTATGKFLQRNAGRGSPTYSTDLFAQKSFALGEKTYLEFRAEVFNIFNHRNIYGRNSNYGSAILGTPSPLLGAAIGGINNADPDRQIQFQTRIRF
ncbi:MAG: TonB-dependent receptor [Pyrinomonadaceae bacterium]